jgi:hypothetical protein
MGSAWAAQLRLGSSLTADMGNALGIVERFEDPTCSRFRCERAQLDQAPRDYWIATVACDIAGLKSLQSQRNRAQGFLCRR